MARVETYTHFEEGHVIEDGETDTDPIAGLTTNRHHHQQTAAIPTGRARGFVQVRIPAGGRRIDLGARDLACGRKIGVQQNEIDIHVLWVLKN